MFQDLTPKDLGGGINLVDLGASGEMSSYWRRLEGFINLYAFEPNQEECERLTKADSTCASTNYIPVAISGKKGSYTLYQTKSIYCWSLLEPNTKWLRRFNFHDLFEVVATSRIEAVSLEEVDQLRDVDVDVIKSDTQGLELPILEAAPRSVHTAFAIETETGLVENYKGETTFHEINRYMEQNDFLLFDINVNHRVPRDNELSAHTRNHQILWCEATWLKDYVAMEENTAIDIDRTKAIKALLLCANHGCIDYGYELAALFRDKGYITKNEYASLGRKSGWLLPGSGGRRSLFRKCVESVIDYLPRRYTRSIGGLIDEISQKPHPFERVRRG